MRTESRGLREIAIVLLVGSAIAAIGAAVAAAIRHRRPRGRDTTHAGREVLSRRLQCKQGRSARPVIVCLCGSTRFGEAFREANLSETLAGRIVLTVGCDMRSDSDLFADLDKDELALVKAGLDELHLRKIDLADEILVLNVGGYVGPSTSREIGYAHLTRKPIRWLEAPASAG